MKKVFSLILVLALMVSMMPAVYAAEITDAAPPAEEPTQPVESTESAPTTENQDPSEATEPPSEEMNVTEATETPETSKVTEPSEAPEEADATEATETTEATDATEPEVNEDPMMSQALIDSGFVTDQIQKKQVGIEDPTNEVRHSSCHNHHSNSCCKHLAHLLIVVFGDWHVYVGVYVVYVTAGAKQEKTYKVVSVFFFKYLF